MIDTEISNLFKVAKSRGIKPIDVLEALENNGRQIYLSIKEELLGLMVFEGIKENGDPSTYSVKKNVYQITPGSRVELWEALDRGEEQADLNIRISLKSSPNKIEGRWIVRVSTDLPSMLAIDYQDYCFLPQSLETVSDPVLPGSPTKPKRGFPKTSPISIFIDEQISNGRYDWQKAWSELRDKIADDKNTKTEDMKLHNFGEKEAIVRRTMKQTSNKLDHAIEYQEDGMPTFKTVSRQDFGRMFREALKKVGVSRRLRNNSDSIPLR